MQMCVGSSWGGGEEWGAEEDGDRGWRKRKAVRVPRQREKERTESQTCNGTALGPLSRALGMYGLYSATLCPAVNSLNETGASTLTLGPWIP